MGASTFEEYAWGLTPQEAFQTAAQEAREEYGSRGYTGSLAEKHDFTVIELPSTWTGTPESYAEHLIDKSDRRIDDKWGPAGCIVCEKQSAKEELVTGVSIERIKQVGTRKWETVYVVTAPHQNLYYRQESKYQTEAEEIAKEYAKRNNCQVSISIQKKLVNGVQEIITIRPKTKEVQSKKTMNKYLFFGWASC